MPAILPRGNEQVVNGAVGMTPEHRDQECLAYDPFAGGKGDDTYRRLSDRFVVTRKPHTCSVCFEAVPAGTRARAMTDLDDGQVRTFYACPCCCDAMAIAADDAGLAIEARYALGRTNTRAEPVPHGVAPCGLGERW